MKQKFTALILSLILALSCAACGDTEAPVSSQPPAAETTLPSEPTAAPESYVFPETVLEDTEELLFSITALEDDPLWGYTMKAYLENRGSRELMFSLDLVSVNGFMCDPFWAATVAPGMKANEEIRFLSTDFQRNGITKPTEIRFTLRIYDANDYTSGALLSKEFTVYPQGEEAVEDFIRTPVAGETVLFENEYAALIVTGTQEDTVWGYGLNVYLENRTDKNLLFSAEDVSVNGFMCDPYWSTTVAPGMRSNTTISWFEETLADNQITEVESIIMTISVSDGDNWMADPLFRETFTVNP